jgi:hypothetical protein
MTSFRFQQMSVVLSCEVYIVTKFTVLYFLVLCHHTDL